MMANAIVGVRTARHDPLRFVQVADDQLPVMTRVIVEEGDSEYLAYVALPSSLLKSAPEDVLRGWVVAADFTSPRVANAVAALDRAALETAREIAGSVVAITSARWSTDLANLEVTLDLEPGAEIPTDLARLGELLTNRFRAAIRPNYADGSALSWTS